MTEASLPSDWMSIAKERLEMRREIMERPAKDVKKLDV
jgi:hypothetical protein